MRASISEVTYLLYWCACCLRRAKSARKACRFSGGPPTNHRPISVCFSIFPPQSQRLYFLSSMLSVLSAFASSSLWFWRFKLKTWGEVWKTTGREAAVQPRSSLSSKAQSKSFVLVAVLRRRQAATGPFTTGYRHKWHVAAWEGVAEQDKQGFYGECSCAAVCGVSGFDISLLN